MAGASTWRGRLPGLRIGTVKGIALRIDSSWILIFLLVAWSASAYFPQATENGLSPGAALLLGFLASFLLFASIVAHELSHSLIARALGYEVRSITLFIFGGVSEIGAEPKSAADEGAIAIAGPLMSFLIAAAAALAATFAVPGGAAFALVRYLAAANLAIAVFNLFPGFPLDGGRVLRAIFRSFGDDLVGSTRKAALAGRTLGLTFVAIGLLTFLVGGFLSGAWMALIGWFLKTSADASWRQVAFRAHAERLKVSEVAERLVPLSVSDTVESALLEHGLLAGTLERYPVVDDQGRLAFMLEVEPLRALPPERWPETRVGALAASPGEPVLPDASLLEALERMTATGEPELPVVDAAGRYRGVLRLDDVARLAIPVISGGSGRPRLAPATKT